MTLKEKLQSRIDEVREVAEAGGNSEVERSYTWGIVDGLEEALIILEDDEQGPRT